MAMTYKQCAELVEQLRQIALKIAPELTERFPEIKNKTLIAGLEDELVTTGNETSVLNNVHGLLNIIEQQFEQWGDNLNTDLKKLQWDTGGTFNSARYGWLEERIGNIYKDVLPKYMKKIPRLLPCVTIEGRDNASFARQYPSEPVFTGFSAVRGKKNRALLGMQASFTSSGMPSPHIPELEIDENQFFGVLDLTGEVASPESTGSTTSSSSAAPQKPESEIAVEQPDELPAGADARFFQRQSVLGREASIMGSVFQPIENQTQLIITKDHKAYLQFPNGNQKDMGHARFDGKTIKIYCSGKRRGELRNYKPVVTMPNQEGEEAANPTRLHHKNWKPYKDASDLPIKVPAKSKYGKKKISPPKIELITKTPLLKSLAFTIPAGIFTTTACTIISTIIFTVVSGEFLPMIGVGAGVGVVVGLAAATVAGLVQAGIIRNTPWYTRWLARPHLAVEALAAALAPTALAERIGVEQEHPIEKTVLLDDICQPKPEGTRTKSILHLLEKAAEEIKRHRGKAKVRSEEKLRLLDENPKQQSDDPFGVVVGAPSHHSQSPARSSDGEVESRVASEHSHQAEPDPAAATMNLGRRLLDKDGSESQSSEADLSSSSESEESQQELRA